jgi:class 3 adenylate cyclase
MLCIGDGYIFVFRDPTEATYFAAYLAHLIEIRAARDELPVEFHFRIGVHAGHAFTFWDPGRRDWNYIGEGINGGQRVSAVIDKKYDDVIYVSYEVRRLIRKSNSSRVPYRAEIIANLQNRGRQLDKHDKPWRVYELNYTALCGPHIQWAT